MPKLTNYMRESIAGRAVSHAFDPKKEALAKAEDALAREAYAFTFPKAETDLIATVPENWFRRDPCLLFNVGGQSIVLNVAGAGLPVPYRSKHSDNGSYRCNTVGVIPHGDLCDRIQKHAQAVEKYKEQRREAKRQVEAMLGSVTTTGKLKEVWPEGEQFYSKYDDVKPPSLPAVRAAEVNAILGLGEAA
ncbi:hypothetical protein GOA90_25310 [Sinorhizobium meliloti]|nr:hypothetical protein [Sinorhizobium meliloti]